MVDDDRDGHTGGQALSTLTCDLVFGWERPLDPLGSV